MDSNQKPSISFWPLLAVIILAVLLAVFLDIQKDQSLITIENQPTTTTTKVFLPNPASVFCRDQGYRLEIRTDENGGQFGVCVFDDGKECEEWAFYRQECGQEYLKEIPENGENQEVGSQNGTSTCENLCGDGICQEVVCLAIGCPCAETPHSCPQDCQK